MVKKTPGSRSWRSHQKRQRRKKLGRLACFVYGLYDPRDPSAEVRYVGQTRNHPTDRMRTRIKDVSQKVAVGARLTPSEVWIADLVAAGFLPEILVIEDAGTWDVSEIIWIERYRARGANLLNILRGGQDTMHGLSLAKTVCA